MDEEYMTAKELKVKTKYAVQTIYNKVNKGIFKLDVHYVKPSSGRLLFKWAAVREWLEGRSDENSSDAGRCIEAKSDDSEKGRKVKTASASRSVCRINI
jgi:hypothetical protein